MPELKFIRMPGLDGSRHIRGIQNRAGWDQYIDGLEYAQRTEMFDPPKELMERISTYQLTLGKEYTILDEKIAWGENNKSKILYMVEDDDAAIYVSQHFFRQPQILRQVTVYRDDEGFQQLL